jgi:HTH-type transcriptional regulator/antitoxin HigA
MFLAEEIAARGMTQKALAAAMGRSPKVINEIIRGKKAITAETALQLNDVLELPAALWLRLEAEYQLALARERRASA